MQTPARIEGTAGSGSPISCSSGCGEAPVVDHVGNEERQGEEHQAEQEVKEEAVPLPCGDAGRPERDRYPDDCER